MTTAERIAAIRARLAAATPGLWERDASKVISPGVLLAWCTDREIRLSILASSRMVQAVANAELIAHAPDDLSWACAEIEAQSKRADDAEKNLGKADREIYQLVKELNAAQREAK